MWTATLFRLGPFNVCLLNLVLISMIFIAAWIGKKLIHKSIKRYLKSSNISIEGRRTTIIKLVAQSVYLFGIYIAVQSFKINNDNISFQTLLEHQLFQYKKIEITIMDIALIVFFFFAARILVNLFKLYFQRKFSKLQNANASSEYVYIQITKYIVYIFTIILSLNALNVDLTLVLTGSAALLVGLGLGLQDVFKDMISGIILLFERNLKIGDIIELMSGDKEPIVAKILKISVRTTQIETRDGNVLIVPNAKLTQDFIENWSHGSHVSRFRILISVAYDSDTELVKKILYNAAAGHPKVKDKQNILVRLANFGNDGLEMELIFHADQSWEINNFRSEIRFEILRLFREHKVTIPFPQRVLTMKREDVGTFTDLG